MYHNLKHYNTKQFCLLKKFDIAIMFNKIALQKLTKRMLLSEQLILLSSLVFNVMWTDNALSNDKKKHTQRSFVFYFILLNTFC